ncbi:hypothetical protein [Halorussus salinisoli]|uniref:hypothetical protein n=1 Tax=Halorussus salinisoli TaxID=2558242 RepID=UPI0010C1C562|nr:hypothetical protein [Halorussus salinisoli]
MSSERSRRRALELAGTTLSLGLAGCTASVRSTDYPTLRVSNEEVPADFADVSATVVRQFGHDAPAEIRIGFTNTTDAEREFSFSASPPFSGLAGRHDDRDAFALLVPLESEVHVAAAIEGLPAPTEVIPDRPTDGCWQAKANLSADPVSVSRRLAPGETLAETYALLAAPVGEEPCPLSGEYRFESNSYFEERLWGFSAILD